MDSVINKIFSKTTWNWWELWSFKAVIFCIGIIFGAFFPTFFLSIMPIIAFLGIGGGIFVTYLWIRKSHF